MSHSYDQETLLPAVAIKQQKLTKLFEIDWMQPTRNLSLDSLQQTYENIVLKAKVKVVNFLTVNRQINVNETANRHSKLA